MLDDKEVQLNEKETQLSARVREIELMDQYNDYLNGRIEAFEARQHFSDQIIENLQEDYDWQKNNNAKANQKLSHICKSVFASVSTHSVSFISVKEPGQAIAV